MLICCIVLLHYSILHFYYISPLIQTIIKYNYLIIYLLTMLLLITNVKRHFCLVILSLIAFVCFLVLFLYFFCILNIFIYYFFHLCCNTWIPPLIINKSSSYLSIHPLFAFISKAESRLVGSLPVELLILT